jgi:hypothetical protein
LLQDRRSAKKSAKKPPGSVMAVIGSSATAIAGKGLPLNMQAADIIQHSPEVTRKSVISRPSGESLKFYTPSQDKRHKSARSA